MPKLTSDEQTELLDCPGVLMRIAVVNANGAPSVTPIWFLHQDNVIFLRLVSSQLGTDASRQIREWRYASMKSVCPIGKCWWKEFQNWCTRQERTISGELST